MVKMSLEQQGLVLGRPLHSLLELLHNVCFTPRNRAGFIIIFPTREFAIQETSVPDILVNNSFNSPSTTHRTRNGGRSLLVDNSGSHLENGKSSMLGEKILNFVGPSRLETESFNMRRLSEEIMVDAVEDNPMEERPALESLDVGCSSSSSFLTPEEISIPSISTSLAPFYHGTGKIQVLHKDVVLKLVCTNLKVRFGISTKFVD